MPLANAGSPFHWLFTRVEERLPCLLLQELKVWQAVWDPKYATPHTFTLPHCSNRCETANDCRVWNSNLQLSYSRVYVALIIDEPTREHRNSTRLAVWVSTCKLQQFCTNGSKTKNLENKALRVPSGANLSSTSSVSSCIGCSWLHGCVVCFTKVSICQRFSICLQYVYIHVCVYIYTYLRVYVYMWKYISVCIYIYTYIYIYMCVFT